MSIDRKILISETHLLLTELNSLDFDLSLFSDTVNAVDILLNALNIPSDDFEIAFIEVKKLYTFDVKNFKYDRRVFYKYWMYNKELK